MTTQTDERVDADTDTDILEGLDFEEAPPTCDYTDCDAEAKAKLVCGVCYQGVELMCQGHTIQTAILKAAHPEELVVFDNTCKHRPEFGNCDIVAL